MLALFTMVENETYFLKKWVTHYGSMFGYDDMYILQHNTFSGEAADFLSDLQAEYKFRVVPVGHPYSYDALWMQRTVQAFQHFLLQSYDTVLHTSADQYLIPTEGGDLFRSIMNYDEVGLDPYLVSAGYEVVHKPDEAAIDWTLPIFNQRSTWYPSSFYTRAAIAKQKLHWMPTLQHAYNVPKEALPTSQLNLVHLHRVDADLCLARHREISSRMWTVKDRNEGQYRYNLIDERELLSRWLISDADDNSQVAAFESIPGNLKGVL